MTPILFIDRDGTLIEEPADFQIDAYEKLRFVPQVIPALLKLRDAGYQFVIVTNQDGLGSESYPRASFEGPNDLMLQIFEDQQQWDDSIRSIYEEWLDDEPEILGDGIDADLPMNRRLCFSHCMNNGGTSMLYLDFDPAPGGCVGQVVRYLHDPDSYAVIAPSFDAYLQQLIDGDYAFIDVDD